MWSQRNIRYEESDNCNNYIKMYSFLNLVNDVVGEGMSLTTTERMHITEIWIKECEKHGMMLMVHVGGAPMKDVKEMVSQFLLPTYMHYKLGQIFCVFEAKHAERKKAGAIVVLPDVYNGPENHYDLMRYLKTVSNVANTTPLLYHHFPKQTRVDSKYFSNHSNLNTMCGRILGILLYYVVKIKFRYIC